MARHRLIDRSIGDPDTGLGIFQVLVGHRASGVQVGHAFKLGPGVGPIRFRHGQSRFGLIDAGHEVPTFHLCQDLPFGNAVPFLYRNPCNSPHELGTGGDLSPGSRRPCHAMTSVEGTPFRHRRLRCNDHSRLLIRDRRFLVAAAPDHKANSCQPQPGDQYSGSLTVVHIGILHLRDLSILL